MKSIVLVIAFSSTCFLPILSFAALSLNKKFDPFVNKSRDRIIPLLFTGVYYYMGYYLLGRIPATGLFRIMLLASLVVILISLMVSAYWKISIHMAGMGGLLGAVLAISFRYGLNPGVIVPALIVGTGLLAHSRIYLEKHSPTQVYAGLSMGMIVMYSILYFI
ncbi:hypothetical protein EYV94_16890 [Puteibacter caeruleilacunae]|nr:hypothetical protein EYV94_16890 [Puteibacter caeruleilacunae]